MLESKFVLEEVLKHETQTPDTDTHTHNMNCYYKFLLGAGFACSFILVFVEIQASIKLVNDSQIKEVYNIKLYESTWYKQYKNILYNQK